MSGEDSEGWEGSDEEGTRGNSDDQLVPRPVWVGLADIPRLQVRHRLVARREHAGVGREGLTEGAGWDLMAWGGTDDVNCERA